MSKIEYLTIATKFVMDYRLGAMESIRRNAYMNNHTGKDIAQDDVDAILVDFINFIAAKNGVDLALYTKDISTQKHVALETIEAP